MPTKKIQNYTIELKKEFVLRKEKVYLLLREKREKVREFIAKQTKKRYIRPSKLLQTALVFFVGKKDRKKRIVQDYQYLNKWTVKNNYLLLLILDIIKSIGTKKVFIKINLRWEYNNIRIKKEDEQKRAFTTQRDLLNLLLCFLD